MSNMDVKTAKKQDERKTIALANLLSASAPGFEEFLTSTMREKIEGFIRVPTDKLSIKESTNVDAFSYGERTSIFLISGREVKITLKIHYSPSRCRELAAYKKLAVDDKGYPSSDAIFSVFAELGNLIAGTIKKELLSLGYIVGISLPIDASIFDEIVSSDKLNDMRYYLHSEVQVEGKEDSAPAKFVIAITVEPTAGEGIDKILNFEAPEKDETPENEEDEFL